MRNFPPPTSLSHAQTNASLIPSPSPPPPPPLFPFSISADLQQLDLGAMAWTQVEPLSGPNDFQQGQAINYGTASSISSGRASGRAGLDPGRAADRPAHWACPLARPLGLPTGPARWPAHRPAHWACPRFSLRQASPFGLTKQLCPRHEGVVSMLHAVSWRIRPSRRESPPSPAQIMTASQRYWAKRAPSQLPASCHGLADRRVLLAIHPAPSRPLPAKHFGGATHDAACLELQRWRTGFF